MINYLQFRHSLVFVAAATVTSFVSGTSYSWAVSNDLDNDSRWRSDRRLVEKITVDADLEQVWNAWTTVEGTNSFLSHDADIELSIGGKYEIFLDPNATAKQRGCEGCTIRSYVPLEMLAFDWNAPPSIPVLRNADIRTTVVIQLETTASGGVDLTLTQLGFGAGEAWDSNYKYFEVAWPVVLSKLKKSLESVSPVITKTDDLRKSVRSVDDRVTVTTHLSPIKYQDFEIILPASVNQVWRLLATNRGLRGMFHREAAIELKPGGLYQDWPGNAKKVLAFVPDSMLSGVGGAPPMFPTVQKGGTWWVYRLESVDAGSTRLRMAVLGWHEQSGDEWNKAFDYFLENNPVYLNEMLYPKAAQAALKATGKGKTKQRIKSPPASELDSVKKPAVLTFGESKETVTKKLESLCTSFTVKQIKPIQLPTASTSQTQIDCEGFRYAGRARKAELVFADGILDLIWILTDASEEPHFISNFTSLYGKPTHELEEVTFFLDHGVAVRNKPHEVLFISERLKKPYAGFLRQDR
jgi:uncharacterized protein YndB with AHSA1/START domain